MSNACLLFKNKIDETHGHEFISEVNSPATQIPLVINTYSIVFLGVLLQLRDSFLAPKFLQVNKLPGDD